MFGGDEAPELRYRPSPAAIAQLSDDGLVDGIRRELARVLETELARRRTVLGPQRDELEILLRGQPATSFASAGEQRRIALLLVMATMELVVGSGDGPTILLVDDVESELDDDRLGRAFDFLRTSVQTIVTTSKRDVLRRFGADGDVLVVDSGRIRPSE